MLLNLSHFFEQIHIKVDILILKVRIYRLWAQALGREISYLLAVWVIWRFHGFFIMWYQWNPFNHHQCSLENKKLSFFVFLIQFDQFDWKSIANLAFVLFSCLSLSLQCSVLADLLSRVSFGRLWLAKYKQWLTQHQLWKL